MTVNKLFSIISGGAPQKADLKRFYGFTLAEVLITLVIIGIIAAMTIPTLMNNTNNHEYVSKLKKTYSTLSQATKLLISENGPVSGWGLTNDETGYQKLMDMYGKVLQRAKICNGSGCFSSDMYTNLDGTDYKRLDTDTRWASLPKFILSDGTLVMFDSSMSPDCTGSFGGVKFCVEIFVDINGKKKPNRWGRDLFEFLVTDNGLALSGCNQNCDTSTTGYHCACRVLREGAMNY